jgi:hypothetical protein
VLVVAFSATACGGSSGSGAGGATKGTGAGPLPVNTGPAPWPAPSDARARILAAGLPALGREVLNYHVHAHLDVFVDGKPEAVPALLGIDVQAAVISPLHTHDASGIIHIEAAAPATFTLGQLFMEWGVRLDDRCTGGYCAPGEPTKVYVDGAPHQGAAGSVALKDAQEVAMVIGTPPAQIPSRYNPGGTSG